MHRYRWEAPGHKESYAHTREDLRYKKKEGVSADVRVYPYNPDNICLCHPDEHVIIDNGTKEKITKYKEEYPASDFEAFFERRELLLKDYPKKN